MAKSRLTKDELPFLKRDLDLDDLALEKLFKVQRDFKQKFESELANTGKESLARYEMKIRNLSAARDQIVQQYEEEIKGLEILVKEMKGEGVIKDKITKGGRGKRDS
jgi:hypothetical protein